MGSIRWGLAALVAATVVSGSGPANAQPPPGDPPAPAGTAPAISEQAKRHFNAGVALLQDPEGEKVEEAYRQFRTAYDLSSSPKILGNMGFCAMRLERDGEAVDAYSRYLREVADIDPDERAQIVRDLQTLTVGIARITVDANVPGATVIDERVPVRGARVTNTYGPVNGKTTLGIRPGHHIFTVKLAGREEATWELEAYAGAKDEHSFVLKEPRVTAGTTERPEEKPSNIEPIILLSAGAAMLIAGTVTGVLALNKTSSLDEHCPNDLCGSGFDLEKERSSTQTLVTLTDVLFLVGGVAVLGGAYWGYRVWSKPDQPPAAPAAPAQPRAQAFLRDWRFGLR